MYSEDIDKVCRFCIAAKPAVGSETHIYCDIIGGYSAKGNTCAKFKYDIFKKPIHKKKSVLDHGFTKDDFTL